jgi:hypothetical protein
MTVFFVETYVIKPVKLGEFAARAVNVKYNNALRADGSYHGFNGREVKSLVVYFQFHCS